MQKPLTWSVDEARQLREDARRAPKSSPRWATRATPGDDARTAVEYVRAGAIGEVREVHVWTNRPLATGRKGFRARNRARCRQRLAWNGPRRRCAPGHRDGRQLSDARRLAWDLFLGVAPAVEYHPVYHPFNWRGWIDWGGGAMGDMGAHLIDHFDVGARPRLPHDDRNACRRRSMARATRSRRKTYYEFPARGAKPPVKLTWYDGGLFPPKPLEFPDKHRAEREGGALLVGSKGKLLHDTYGSESAPAARSLHASFGNPPQKLPRIPDETTR